MGIDEYYAFGGQYEKLLPELDKNTCASKESSRNNTDMAIDD